MMALLTDSDMIAPMSLEVARLLEGSGEAGLVSLDLTVPIDVSPYHVITRRGRHLSPAAHRLHALVVEEIGGPAA